MEMDCLPSPMYSYIAGQIQGTLVLNHRYFEGNSCDLEFCLSGSVI